jgi:hypothetical protein
MRKMEAASVADLVRMSQRLAIVLALTMLLPWN